MFEKKPKKIGVWAMLFRVVFCNLLICYLFMETLSVDILIGLSPFT